MAVREREVEHPTRGRKREREEEEETEEGDGDEDERAAKQRKLGSAAWLYCAVNLSQLHDM
jgi:hypothetical protein